MIDRQSAKPGRMLITPEDGQAPYYAKVEMADEPTEVGTPLNKENLLKDSTAELFGLTGAAVPDEVLVKLANITSVLSNSTIKMVYGTYKGDGKTSRVIDLGFEPDVVILARRDGFMKDAIQGRNAFGGIVLKGNKLLTDFDRPNEFFNAEIVSNGFKIYYGGDSRDYSPQSNQPNVPMYYVAFGKGA